MSGRLELAKNHFITALQIEPNDGIITANLATVFLHQGRSHEAIAIYKKALELKANIAGIYDQLGLAYQNTNQGEKALEAFDKALIFDPEYSKAQENLANTYLRKGDKKKAIGLYNQLLNSGEDNFTALMAMGNFHLDSNFPGSAVRFFEKAKKLAPKDFKLNLLLAKTYNSCGMHKRALEYLDFVEKKRPEYAQGYSDQASILENLGEFKKAELKLKTCLALEPNSPHAIFLMSLIRPLPPQSPEVAILQRRIASPSTAPQIKTICHFALGKSAQDSQHPDEAMLHYIEGNAIRRAQEIKNGAGFDKAKYLTQVDAVIKIFSRSLFQKYKKFGNASDRPVFIGGMPRSGTTLTEQIIDSHPQAFGAGELMDLPHLSQTIRQLTRTKEGFPKNVPLLDKSGIETLSNRYLKTLEGCTKEALRVSNKLPGNFMYMGLIRLLFPNAPLIHCRRNSMDNCFSCFTTNFSTGHVYSLDLADLGFYWTQYERIMDHWEKVFPGEILHIDYETTVEEPEATAKRIIEHCGLEWDPICIDFHKNKRPIMTASKRQVRKPIYKTSVERWHPYAKHLKPLMEALGIEG